MDLITLSMPVYNVERYVEKALLSALNQTYDNIEFIVVDDRGADDSMKIVRNILSSHPRGKEVKIIEHPQNIGLGATRNTAIDAAQGKYIFFMDSDDEISPDCIEKLYAKMQADDVDFVIGSYKRLLRTGETLTDHIGNYPCIRGHLEVAVQFFEKRNSSIPVFTWNKLYNTTFIRDNQIYCLPSHLNEDNLFSFQLFLHATSCSFVSEPTYFYYDTPDSVINQSLGTNMSSRIGRQFTEIIAFEWEYAQNYRQEKIYESLLSYIIFYTFYLSLKIKKSTVISPKEKDEYLKKITAFPLSLKEIVHLKRKKLFFVTMWFIFQMPFKVLIFEIILKLSTFKKKIFNE